MRKLFMRTPPEYWETQARAASVSAEAGVRVTSDLELNMHAANLIIAHSYHKNMSIEGLATTVHAYSDAAHRTEGIEPPAVPYRLSAGE